MNKRKEEILVGTRRGVVKCHIVNRLAEGERWYREATLAMKGLPWEFVLGKIGLHISTNMDEDGQCDECDEDDPGQKQPVDDEQETDQPYKKSYDSFHVSQRAIGKCWATDGCPPCRAIQRGGNCAGRIGFSNSKMCRERIIELMRNDPENRHATNKSKTDLDDGKLDQLSRGELAIMVKRVKDVINHINKKIKTEQNK